MADKSTTTPSEESQPKPRSRFVEARERFATRLYWWADTHLRWLWRRLGSYCNCRRDILSEEGIREEYRVRIGRTRAWLYEAQEAGVMAGQSGDRWVVARSTSMRIPFTHAHVGSLDVLCACGGWIPVNAHPGNFEPTGDTLRWADRGIRRMLMSQTFRSASSAERKIDQITGSESRIRSWLRWGLDVVLVVVTLIAVCGPSSIPESGPFTGPEVLPRQSDSTDAPAP